MTMNIRKWIKCRWIILFAWYNRSYCFRRKALRHLISFTTLNKFYDPSIKKNCKEHCVWTVFICFDHKIDRSTPLTDGRCKISLRLVFLGVKTWLTTRCCRDNSKYQDFYFLWLWCVLIVRDENRETASRESIRCYHGRSNYYVTAFYGTQCGEILAMGLKYHSVKYTNRSK